MAAYKLIALVALALSVSFCAQAEPMPSPTPHAAPTNRAASVYVAQDFINEQIAQHSSSELIQKMNVELDPTHESDLSAWRTAYSDRGIPRGQLGSETRQISFSGRDTLEHDASRAI